MNRVKCNMPPKAINEGCLECRHATPHVVDAWCRAMGAGCYSAHCIDVPAQENEVGHSRYELDIKQKLNVKEESTMTWGTGFTIKTPKGDYKPKSDDLAAEIKAAARYAGVKHPHVTIGFDAIEGPADLPVACISGLDEGTEVEVSVYDEAGR